MNQNHFEQQDIGYLLTAYADGQLAPEGVMWVEEQLDTNADLRGKLKEIRQLQAGLRAAFAGGAPEFVLDLPRRNALLASAANPPRKKIRFQPLLWSGLAASILAVVMVTAGANARYSATPQAFAIRESGEFSDRFETMSMNPGKPSTGVNYFAEEKSVDALADVAAPTSEPVQSLNLTLAKNDEEVAALREQNRALGDELEARRRGLAEANGLAGKAEPELLAKGKREDLGRDGAVARKSLAATPASPPEPTQSAQDQWMAHMEADAKPATKESNGYRLVPAEAAKPGAPAKPAAPVAAAAPAPASPPPSVVAPTRPAQQLARAERRTAGTPGVAQQRGRADQDEVGEDKAADLKAADRQVPTTSNATFAGVGGGAGPSAGENAKSQSTDGLERGANNEKTNLAQVGKDVAFKLEVQLAETEDDYNNAAVALAQREEQKKQAEKVSQDGRLQAEAGTRYPKIYAEIAPQPDSPVTGVAAAVRNNPQGVADLVMLTLGKGEPPAAGTQFYLYRGDRYIVTVRTEKVQGDMIAGRIVPESWNGEGLQIQQGDLASTHFGDGVPAPRAAPQRWLADVGAFDPQQSLAALRAPVTLDGAMGVAQTLRLIGGERVGFDAGTVPSAVLASQVITSLRDEPAARGILRAVRSAGLQAQFTGGLVKLDTATRPLDPSDAQGYDLPTFKDLFGTQPMQATAVDPIQTVAIDADTASYEYAKARVASGQPIDAATIKPEHFINAMPMDYPAAQGPEAFSLYAEAAPSPFARANTAWGARTAVVSIGAVAKPAAADERKPLALTLAIDCSGSMAQAGGLDRIQRGLLAFIEHLRAEDRVSIVAFGDQARVILPATPGNDRAALTSAVTNLATGGATNAAEGLGLAYQLAAETAAAGVESRVLLATDGGTVAGADDLLRRVTAFKDRGITLVVVGTGATYRAGPLQELAAKGDGQHFYVGSDDDAQALFTGRLLPDRIAVLAKDAKLQVTWNPQRISHARLIGYDQRRLAAKDFRNNAVDAGELSQDTQVTALFEVLLVDGGTGPLGTAAVRYHDMRRDQVRELACPLPGTILQSQPSDRLRLLSCAAATAEWLQRGWWSNVHLITPDEIRAQLARCPQPIANELRMLVR